MTALEIAALCLAAGLDEVAVDRGAVLFCDRFATADEGPREAAAERLSFWRDSLAPLGLRVANAESDGDSVWGEIVTADANR